MARKPDPTASGGGPREGKDSGQCLISGWLTSNRTAAWFQVPSIIWSTLPCIEQNTPVPGPCVVPGTRGGRGTMPWERGLALIDQREWNEVSELQMAFSLARIKKVRACSRQ
jgi:hypothetical protein